MITPAAKPRYAFRWVPVHVARQTDRAIAHAAGTAFYTGTCRYGHTGRHRTSDGKCLVCVREASARHRLKCGEKPRRIVAAGMKYCPACTHELAHSEFGQNRSRRDGLQATCRPCRAVYHQSRKSK